MKHNKNPWFALIALLPLLAMLAGCGTAASTSPSAALTPTPAASPAQSDRTAYPVTVTDIMGQTVTFDKAPQRIVTLSATCTEIAFALELGDRVIGVDSYSNYPSQAESLPKVGDYAGPNIEAITELEPDLVLAANKLQQDAVSRLEQLGIQVLAVEGSDYEQIYSAIEIVGKACDKGDLAQEIISGMKQARQTVIDKANAITDKPVVYYVMSYGDENWTSGPGSFINQMIEDAGGICVTKDDPVPWMNYNLEKVADADPDVLLISSMGGPVEGLKQTNVYKDLTAVKNDRIVVLDADISNRAGPRIMQALEMVFNALHPQDDSN